MRRVGLPLLCSLLAVLALAFPVQAGEGWCMSDPIVELDGLRVQILVAIPAEAQPLVHGPIDVGITTSKGVKRHIVFLDAGFNGHGEKVTFSDGGIRSSSGVGVLGTASSNTSFSTRIRVSVPLSGATVVPTQVTVIADNAPPVVVLGTSDGVVVELFLTKAT